MTFKTLFLREKVGIRKRNDKKKMAAKETKSYKRYNRKSFFNTSNNVFKDKKLSKQNEWLF